MSNPNTQPVQDQAAAQHRDILATCGVLTALAAAGAEPTEIGNYQHVIVPQGYKREDISEAIEKAQPAPNRKRGTVVVKDLDSLLLLCKDQFPLDSFIYADPDARKITAVFNDTRGTAAGWRDHRATYACPLSPEWTTWNRENKRTMTQEAFAQFIEDNAPDCVAPDSATMIEISRTLEAKKKVNFASGIRLSNGQSELTYEEEITGTAGKGKLQIPETFQIGIAVLQGGPRYAVVARLRYRIQDKGQLVLWFDLDRPHKVIEDAARDVWTKVQADTGLPIINGQPE